MEIAENTQDLDHFFFGYHDLFLKDLFLDRCFPWEPLARLHDFCLRLKNSDNHSLKYPGVYFKNMDQIVIEPDCILEPGSFIEGPVYLGSKTEVRHGAYVRGFVVTGSKAVIGHTTEIKNSILCNGAKAPHFAYVGDSILGSCVNLGAGVKCANLRLDRRNVAVRWLKQKHDTNQKKLGALIGANCQIGCNTVLNPGSIVHPNTLISPMSLIRGEIFDS